MPRKKKDVEVKTAEVSPVDEKSAESTDIANKDAKRASENLTEGAVKESRAEKYRKAQARTFKNHSGKFTIDGEDEVPKMSEEKIAAGDLMASYEKQQPLRMELTGVEPIVSGDKTIMTPICDYKGHKVIVPLNHLFPAQQLARDDTEKRKFESIGAMIDIVPLSPGKDERTGKPLKPFFTNKAGQPVVLASRVNAMEIIKNEYWFATNEDTKTGKIDYVFIPGKIVVGYVMYVMKGALIVDCRGVESTIKVEDVSYALVENLKDKFKPGDRVDVMLKEVERDPETGSVAFKGSIKEAYPDPRETAYTKLVRGGKYKGVVFSTNDNFDNDLGARAFVKIGGKNGVDVLCTYPDHLYPRENDVCTITITNKTRSNLRLYGHINHIQDQGE